MNQLATNYHLKCLKTQSSPRRIDPSDDVNDDNGRLIEEEAALTGRVKWGVYGDYAKSIGVVGAVVVIFFYFLGQGLHTFSNVS